MDRKGLQALTRIRLLEAKALIDARMYNGAYYLAGYAVECALKACIAKGTRRHEFPEKKRVDASYTHNLRELVRVARLEDARVEEAKRDAEFRDNWDVVLSWSEQSRYEMYGPETAQELVNAIEDRNHGVIRWLRRYW